AIELCPGWDSNPHCMAFETIACCRDWATGAKADQLCKCAWCQCTGCGPLEGGPDHAHAVVSEDEASFGADLKGGRRYTRRSRVALPSATGTGARLSRGVPARMRPASICPFRYPHACEPDIRPRGHRRR